MHHHVITRFNIRSRLLYDDSWFVHRLGLFEKYTLPSMERQTNTNFTWHILFDRERTEAHMDKVENLKRSNGFISLHFFEKDDRPITHLAKQISAREEPLLTTRIDNDDIAHPDYVQLIQNAASRALERGIESPEIIDFKRFYCWSPDERKMSCRSPSYPSAFISLIEPPSPFVSKRQFIVGSIPCFTRNIQ
jgi:hypothetical protein